MSAAPRARALLVTWDIDGTLLDASTYGNRAHKQAIEDAVSAVYGAHTKVDDVPHNGSTDRAIIRDMCRAARVAERTIADRMPAAIAHADRAIAHLLDPDLSHLVLPGVRDALAALRRRGVALALTTGNLESCAWAKIAAAGLKDFFVTGGFGSDCVARTDILRTAVQRVTQLGDGFVEHREGGALRNVFHIGDATSDMQAARENGARGIGVLTGSFSRAQLEEEGAHAVLDNLSDTNGFLELLGLEGK